jgi:hypothetical protein
LRRNARHEGIGISRKEIRTANLEINATRGRIVARGHNNALCTCKVAALVHSIDYDAKDGQEIDIAVLFKNASAKDVVRNGERPLDTGRFQTATRRDESWKPAGAR